MSRHLTALKVPRSNIVCVSNGVEALQRLGLAHRIPSLAQYADVDGALTVTPGVVFMDIELGGISGVEVMREIVSSRASAIVAVGMGDRPAAAATAHCSRCVRRRAGVADVAVLVAATVAGTRAVLLSRADCDGDCVCSPAASYPVIAVSGNTDEASMELYRASGFSGVLHKPFDIRGVTAAITQGCAGVPFFIVSK